MLDEYKLDQLTEARIVGTVEATLASEGRTDARPVAVMGGKAYELGYITKARVLYFFMGLSAAMFIAADVIAEFDGDPDTLTATNWVKKGRSHWAGLGAIIAFIMWLALHFLADWFPL